MHSDFSLFRDRLAEACHLRQLTQAKLCASVGLSGRRAVDFELSGIKAIDVHQLALIADRLDVSIDWLVGRTDVMKLPEKAKARSARPSAPRRE